MKILTISSSILVSVLLVCCHNSNRKTTRNNPIHRQNDAKHLTNHISYIVFQKDSVQFFVNNIACTPVTLPTTHGVLILDSLLIIENGNYSKSADLVLGDKYIIKLKSNYGRMLLLVIDSKKKSVFGIDDKPEYRFSDLCYVKEQKIFITNETGFGKDPGVIYVDSWLLTDRFENVFSYEIDDNKLDKLFLEAKSNSRLDHYLWDYQLKRLQEFKNK